MGMMKIVDKKFLKNQFIDFHLSHRTNPDFKFEPNEILQN